LGNVPQTKEKTIKILLLGHEKREEKTRGKKKSFNGAFSKLPKEKTLPDPRIGSKKKTSSSPKEKRTPNDQGEEGRGPSVTKEKKEFGRKKKRRRKKNSSSWKKSKHILRNPKRGKRKKISTPRKRRKRKGGNPGRHHKRCYSTPEKNQDSTNSEKSAKTRSQHRQSPRVQVLLPRSTCGKERKFQQSPKERREGGRISNVYTLGEKKKCKLFRTFVLSLKRGRENYGGTQGKKGGNKKCFPYLEKKIFPKE